MGEGGFPLRVVDGLELDRRWREVLRPGQILHDRERRPRRLPRFFYEIPSWDVALETPLAEHFQVWEFLNVDALEADVLRTDWPRYLPCAVSLLAAHLELFRREVGTYVHVAANGGYRSPGHRLSTHASRHCWGTAVNLYHVGDDTLDDEATLRKYARAAQRTLPAVWVRPYGHGVGDADDHLHLDLGYTVMVPHGVAGEAGEPNGDDDSGERVADRER